MSRRLLAVPLALLGLLLAAPAALAEQPSAIGVGSDGTSYVGYPLSGGVQRIAVDGSTTALPAWGTAGTGAGQLGGAVGIAVAPGADGHVWVLDSNLRVQEFTRGGQFVKGTQLPACTAGVAPDATRFGGIDVRVDGASTTPVALYVSHPCANQVLKLDPASPTLAVTRTAATTSRPGRIASPRYLTGPTNTRAVYVALPEAQAVTSFAPADLGAGPDALRQYDFTPSDLYVDEYGQLFVGDLRYDIVRIYDDKGNQLRYRGGTGNGTGLFSGPQAFDVAGQENNDTKGNLFVADSGNSRVQRMDQYSFTYWAAEASGTSGGPVTQPPTSGAPSIAGSAVVGQTLTCNPGTWTGSPTFTYSWRRDGSQVATGSTYAVTSGDVGRAITCVVTGTNGAGSATATSAAVTPAAAPVTPAPVSTGAPSIQGTVAVGQQLTCTQGSWSNAPTGYAYSWRRDGGEVATGSQYTPTSADAGRAITCVVTASNAGGSSSATSPAVTPPTPTTPVAAPANTARPGIQGTTVVGSTLTATQGSWSNAPTGYAYAWRRGGVAIPGATGTSYALVAADAGRTISVAVTATNAGGSATAVSDGVAVTAAPATPSTRVGVTINGGAEATSTAAVSLRIREPAGATAVLISNDGSFDTPTQVPVVTSDTYSWTLDARGSERRARVVYVRFVGPLIDGNQTFTDDILLDTTAPTVTTATISARTTASSGTVRVAAKDSGSGVSTIQYARNQSPTGARTLKPTKARSFKVRPRNARWVRAVDVAGNKSKWKRIAFKAPRKAARRR
ncbi:unannotated protein [freshwater metagenome]|uniref:Unannotated protein n=1 Tax=freshwater metagenome TaxID=449393 RepID=A0A6J7H7C0_9ZZZZ|nr:hypothetical protein [Actinomycetota bacterium]